MVKTGLPGTRLGAGLPSMGIALPITIGLPMGVTWPVTPPMTRIHVQGGEEPKRASPNKSTDSGFSDSGESEASSSPGDTRGHQGGNHVSRVYLFGKEEKHYQSPSLLPIIKVANNTIRDDKKKGGKRRSGDELSTTMTRVMRGSPVHPRETKSCNEEKVLPLQEYKRELASFSCLAGGNTCADSSFTCSPPPPNQGPPSINRSASISLSSPAFSNFSEISFQNFSETSSRNGDLSSGSSPTQTPILR